jgi:hypothetical protein
VGCVGNRSQALSGLAAHFDALDRAYVVAKGAGFSDVAVERERERKRDQLTSVEGII